MASPWGPDRKRARPAARAVGPLPRPEPRQQQALCIRHLVDASGFLRHCLQDVEGDEAELEAAAGAELSAELPEACISLEEVVALVPASAHLSEGARCWLPLVLLWLSRDAAACEGAWWMAAAEGPALIGESAALGRHGDRVRRQAAAAVQLLALGRFLLSRRPREEVILWITYADDSASCSRALVLALLDGPQREGYGIEEFFEDAGGAAEEEVHRWCLANGLEALGLRLRGYSTLVRRLLGDSSGKVRVAMARTVGQISDDLVLEFVDEFLVLLAGCHAEARGTAAAMLGRADAGRGRVPFLATRLASLLEDSDRMARESACKGLVAMGSAAVDACIEVLRSGSRPAQEGAARALAAIGELAAPAVAQVLAAESEAPRVWALRALRDMGHGAAAHVDAIAALLEHTMPRLRREALETLAKHGQAAAKHSDAIARCLESEDWSVRVWAARAVSSLPEAAVQPHLSTIAGLVTDFVPDVVEAAAFALGKLCGISGPYAVQLAQVFVDNDQPSSDAAAAAFRAMLRSNSVGTREAAAAALRGADEEAVLRLAPELAERAALDDDRHVREECLRALAALGTAAPPCAVQAAEAMLRDGDKVLRRAAVEALQEMGPDAVAAHEADLRELLDTAPVGLRRAVLAALNTLPAAPTGTAAKPAS